MSATETEISPAELEERVFGTDPDVWHIVTEAEAQAAQRAQRQPFALCGKEMLGGDLIGESGVPVGALPCVPCEEERARIEGRRAST